MSGSHGQPEPPSDARYSLEDTVYEMPPVWRGYAHSEHVLSGAIPRYKPGDACAIQAEPPAADNGHDTRTYDQRTDERLKALETAVAELQDAFGALALRLESRK